MNKIIGLAVLLFCLSGCVRDNDAIYYPVGNVDVEGGGPAWEAGKGVIIPKIMCWTRLRNIRVTRLSVN